MFLLSLQITYLEVSVVDQTRACFHMYTNRSILLVTVSHFLLNTEHKKKLFSVTDFSGTSLEKNHMNSCLMYEGMANKKTFLTSHKTRMKACSLTCLNLLEPTFLMSTVSKSFHNQNKLHRTHSLTLHFQEMLEHD